MNYSIATLKQLGNLSTHHGQLYGGVLTSRRPAKATPMLRRRGRPSGIQKRKKKKANTDRLAHLLKKMSNPRRRGIPEVIPHDKSNFNVKDHGDLRRKLGTKKQRLRALDDYTVEVHP